MIEMILIAWLCFVVVATAIILTVVLWRSLCDIWRGDF